MSIDDIASPDPEPAVADHLGRIGAEQLAQRTRAYWSGLGHDQVRVWVERAGTAAPGRSEAASPAACRLSRRDWRPRPTR